MVCGSTSFVVVALMSAGRQSFAGKLRSLSISRICFPPSARKAGGRITSFGFRSGAILGCLLPSGRAAAVIF